MASREQQKERRRQQILDAAEDLIRETNATSFTMLELAERAHLSPTTPYNLFGSKGAILYTLLNRAFDTLTLGGEEVQRGHPDPVESVVMTMGRAVDFFIGDPALLRALYQFQLGELDPINRPVYMDRAVEYWRGTVQRLIERYPEGGFRSEELARALLAHSIGVLDHWVQEELDDTEFRAQMEHDAALLLFAVVDEAGRERLMTIIRNARPHMSARSSFLSAPSQARVRAG